MKKIGMVVLPVITLILEILPFGAVLVFAPSPTERIRETYSYFSLTPFGYANFAPFVTGLLTCVLLISGIWTMIRYNQKTVKTVFSIAVAAAIVSLTPLVYGLDYCTVWGGAITFMLILEAVLSFVGLNGKNSFQAAD